MDARHANAGLSPATQRSRLVLLGAAAAIVLSTVTADSLAGNDRNKEAPIAFKEARLIIEFNSSAEDIGVQFFLDSEGWKSVGIFSPNGQQIFEAEASGKLLRQGGGTELFVESEEPPLSELPLDVFLRRFPEGTYRFAGRAPDGTKLFGEAEFSHDIPAGPEVLMPPAQGEDECTENVALPLTVAWNEVTTSIDDEPIDIEEYEVIVGDGFDIRTTGTMVTVPDGLLEPGTSYTFEVLAVADNGNQTISEGCFVTAD